MPIYLSKKGTKRTSGEGMTLLIDNVWYLISEGGEIVGVDERMTEWHKNWSHWDEARWRLKEARRLILRSLVRPTYRYSGHFWHRLLTRLCVVHGGAVIVFMDDRWPELWLKCECVKCDVWHELPFDDDLIPRYAPIVGEKFVVTPFECGNSEWLWDGDVHHYEHPDG